MLSRNKVSAFFQHCTFCLHSMRKAATGNKTTNHTTAKQQRMREVIAQYPWKKIRPPGKRSQGSRKTERGEMLREIAAKAKVSVHYLAYFLLIIGDEPCKARAKREIQVEHERFHAL